MAKKDDKDDEKPGRFLGVGASGDIDNPAKGASAFGPSVEFVEPTEKTEKPHKKEHEDK